LEAVDLGPCFAYRHREANPAGERTGSPKRKAVPLPPAPPVAPVLAEPPPWERSVPRTVTAPPLAPAPVPAAARPPGFQERLLAASRDLAANRVDEAGRILAELLAADPAEPAAHALEGFLHDLRGRAEDAVTSYRAALYLDPSLFQVRVLLADCLLRLGHRERAEHQFREVLTLFASGRERTLTMFEGLPLPDRDRAQKRCRQVLKGG
jgi:hypothetical protein